MNEKEFNRPKIKKALPVMVHFEKEDHAPEEFLKLIKSANYNIEESVRSKLSKIDAKTFLGKGLVEQTYCQKLPRCVLLKIFLRPNKDQKSLNAMC